MTAQTINPTPSRFLSLSLWWNRLAYRHKWAEVMLYLMFISGLLLWSMLDIDWQLQRWLLFAHLLLGVTAFTAIVGLFWCAHRRLLLTSNKKFLRTTGQLTEVLLALCSLSGFYLFFYGNTGNLAGFIVQNIHFYSSWLLVPLVFRHALRWSVVKMKWLSSVFK